MFEAADNPPKGFRWAFFLKVVFGVAAATTVVVELMVNTESILVLGPLINGNVNQGCQFGTILKPN